MATRIRLQRHGRKARPFYHVVIADARAKRDGRFIEKIGTYDPNHNPAMVEINNDRALHWLMVGAQPSDTVRAMLSYRGVMLKKHLLEGVRKGALTEEQAEAKHQAWLEEKDGSISTKISGLAKAKEDAKAKALAQEKEANQKKAEEIAAKNAPEVVEEEVAEEAATEETTTEATETPAPAEDSKEEDKA
ncbi:MAG: 30S ribosomal protein S16 [Flavobacteriales bacterium]